MCILVATVLRYRILRRSVLSTPYSAENTVVLHSDLTQWTERLLEQRHQRDIHLRTIKNAYFPIIELYNTRWHKTERQRALVLIAA